MAAIYRFLANKELMPGFRGPDNMAYMFLPAKAKFFLSFSFFREHFKRKLDEKGPGSYAYVSARARFFDELFVQAVSKHIPQIVFLGAGYDTRAIRFQKNLNGTVIFELDVPGTQDEKRKLLRKNRISIPENLHFVPINFERDNLKQILRLYTLIHQSRAFFVTRAKYNMQYEIISSADVDQQAGLISDQLVKLTGYKSSKSYPEAFRLVIYEDYATDIVYTFMTNDFDLPALSIAELYRERWKVELFFKWIKQHLHIKAFFGTSQNAVACQIWIAICTYLLIAIAKKKLDMAITLYTFAQTLGLTLFEKTPIKELFNNKNLNINLSDENQLSLWNS